MASDLFLFASCRTDLPIVQAGNQQEGGYECGLYSIDNLRTFMNEVDYSRDFLLERVQAPDSIKWPKQEEVLPLRQRMLMLFPSQQAPPCVDGFSEEQKLGQSRGKEAEGRAYETSVAAAASSIPIHAPLSLLLAARDPVVSSVPPPHSHPPLGTLTKALPPPTLKALIMEDSATHLSREPQLPPLRPSLPSGPPTGLTPSCGGEKWACPNNEDMFFDQEVLSDSNMSREMAADVADTTTDTEEGR